MILATSLSDVSPKVPRLSAVVTDATPEHVASAGLEAAVWRWDPGRGAETGRKAKIGHNVRKAWPAR